jgi:hypothetical protein
MQHKAENKKGGTASVDLPHVADVVWLGRKCEGGGLKTEVEAKERSTCQVVVSGKGKAGLFKLLLNEFGATCPRLALFKVRKALKMAGYERGD